MPHHISNLGDIAINWVEDQPVIRDVRKQMEQDGFINDLINQLNRTNKSQIRQEKAYKLHGQSSAYICLVIAYSDTNPNQPKYRVAIKPSKSTLEWDAIGDVYAGNTLD